MPGAPFSPQSQAMMARAHKAKQIRSSHSAAPRATILGVSIFLLAITWQVFEETLRHEPINFDDPGYVFRNPQITTGLTSTGILWAFTHSCMQNWHPLTWISHMLDCQFFGLNAGGHHFTNVLLHTIAVILLFLLFQKMTGALWRSAFVAAVFTIHPLRLESVAWIAERKDVLSGVFFMLTLLAYRHYVRAPSLRRYLAVATACVFGLMSKPMLVTLPFVLLLLDYWPLNRTGAVPCGHVPTARPSPDPPQGCRYGAAATWLKLFVEKIPLLGLAAVSSVVTLFAQKGAVGFTEQLPVITRINNAAVSYVLYIWQMFWPVKLAVFYPHPENRIAIWEIVLALGTLAAITALAFVLRKTRHYFITGWLWYLGMLVPVIGIVQVGWQGRADRYTYLPQIGLYIVSTWAIADFTRAWRHQLEVLTACATIVIVTLVWCAWVQTSYWRDSETLFKHALAVTTNNDVAENNLGIVYLQ